MKKILLIAALCLSLAGSGLQAQEPTDITAMRDAGLTDETLGRFLAQNLDGNRVAPQVDSHLLSRLAGYGGNDLAAAYLELDRATAHLVSRDFSPEVVAQLMESGMEASDLVQLLKTEAASSPAPVARPEKAAKTIPGTPPLPPQKTAKATAPSVIQPSVPVRPVSAPVSPRRSEMGWQDLRPGQAADPASRLPLPYSTYDIRRPKSNGPWMGVSERELPDGHVVEVNTIGDANTIGQEVLSRPTGHKVYRYYSGNPSDPRAIRSSTEPEQEQRNREDLQIIFSGG